MMQLLASSVEFSLSWNQILPSLISAYEKLKKLDIDKLNHV